MTTHKIPNITINKINSINKFFLWNASNNTHRKGPINWNTISSPKDQGGLGFRNLFILNQAYLLKMGWRLKNNENSLWSKTIKGKYYPHNCFDNTTEPKSYHSGYWKNIYKTKTILKDTCICIMGNGKISTYGKTNGLVK